MGGTLDAHLDPASMMRVESFRVAASESSSPANVPAVQIRGGNSVLQPSAPTGGWSLECSRDGASSLSQASKAASIHDALNIGISLGEGNGYMEGTCSRTSLQDLLIGFTSGSLRFQMTEDHSTTQENYAVNAPSDAVHSDKHDTEEHGILGGSYIEEDDDEDYLSQEHLSAGSDADNEHTDTENLEERSGYAVIDCDTDDGVGLDNLSLAKIYSTAQVMLNNTCENQDGQTVKESENKEGWTKKRRISDGSTRQPFRKPKGMGAIESAMRKHCEKKKKGGTIFEPYLALEFDSEGEAFQFYNLYSMEVGFGIRKGNADKNQSGYQTSRDLVCQKQGYDKRTKKITKRCHCKAMIRLHRTTDDGWFISSFIKDHNHPLSATDEENKEWNSHKQIDEETRAMIKNLRENNVTLNKVHSIMGSLYGSMDNIPFSRRSMKTICAQIAREQRDDDIKKTLELFRQMRSDDPGFQFSVQLDDQDQIKTLIWASGRCRSNYCCFGDVVTFDTTYCTNLYKMPFGLFVGVNNHFQTTIFAGVLMRDETADSFKWVFKEFLTLMGGVHPQTILTDQCRAMEIALTDVMPDTTHLWCRWHVFRDARVELGTLIRENLTFKDEFHRVITEMYTVDEFTANWNALLKKYDLQTHHYMVKAYEKREKWAKCYNRGTFCARMTSTQRSESANHMLKTVVPRNSSLNRFVFNLQTFLHQRYAEEERAEHQTKQELRVYKPVWDVEKHARKLYTRKVFTMFSEEMEKIRRYGVPTTRDNVVFHVRHTNAEYVEQYRRAEFKVIRINDGERYECECGLSEHFGLLCCHILRVFIHIGVSEIPQAHIMHRWTRKARDVIPESLKEKCARSSQHYGQMYLQAQIHGKAMEVARKGKFNYDTCAIVLSYLQEAERKVEEFIRNMEEEANAGNVGNQDTDDNGNGNYMPSDSEAVSGNRFGASGSCAGMSDEEIMNIKAPPRPVKQGAPKQTRFHSFLDKIEKRHRAKLRNNSTVAPINRPVRKKASGKSTRVTPHCTQCRAPGHNKTKCPYAPAMAEDDI